MEAEEPFRAIRRRRLALGLSQARLAQRAGLPQSHVARLETGKVDAQWSTLKKVFRALLCEAVVAVKPRRRAHGASAGIRKDETTGSLGGGAVVRDRAHWPIRIVERDDDRDRLRFWLRQPLQARIAAVESLNRMCDATRGRAGFARLERTLTLREMHGRRPA